jgi:hypothetical protein
MRRILIALLVCVAPALFAADAGKIDKVLPFFLDTKGRISKSPSLFDRDAYQVHLRKHTNEVSGVRYDVQCSAEKTLKLRLELRGVGDKSAPKLKTIEADVAPGGAFNNWTQIKFDGADYQQFGVIVAWRATLWDGDKQLSEQKSFLW